MKLWCNLWVFHPTQFRSKHRKKRKSNIVKFDFAEIASPPLPSVSKNCSTMAIKSNEFLFKTISLEARTTSLIARQFFIEIKMEIYGFCRMYLRGEVSFRNSNVFFFFSRRRLMKISCNILPSLHPCLTEQFTSVLSLFLLYDRGLSRLIEIHFSLLERCLSISTRQFQLD